MNLVDSSGWLEYFADSKNAKYFSSAIENLSKLIVPTISIYEVFKSVLIQKNESYALEAIAHMRLGRVINLDTDISLLAAKVSKENGLPMADSVILATARLHNATVWTQDADFNGLDNVKYFKK